MRRRELEALLNKVNKIANDAHCVADHLEDIKIDVDELVEQLQELLAKQMLAKRVQERRHEWDEECGAYVEVRTDLR